MEECFSGLKEPKSCRYRMYSPNHVSAKNETYYQNSHLAKHIIYERPLRSRIKASYRVVYSWIEPIYLLTTNDSYILCVTIISPFLPYVALSILTPLSIKSYLLPLLPPFSENLHCRTIRDPPTEASTSTIK